MISYILLLTIVLLLPVATTTTAVYATSWEEDREECDYYGGYWKHNFCVYDYNQVTPSSLFVVVVVEEMK